MFISLRVALSLFLIWGCECIKSVSKWIVLYTVNVVHTRMVYLRRYSIKIDRLHQMAKSSTYILTKWHGSSTQWVPASLYCLAHSGTIDTTPVNATLYRSVYLAAHLGAPDELRESSMTLFLTVWNMLKSRIFVSLRRATFAL